jgi:hypothetical protein
MSPSASSTWKPWLASTAVVASAVGGIKEVVIDGVTGYLVPLEQQQVAPFEPLEPGRLLPVTWLSAVNKVLDDPATRRFDGRCRPASVRATSSVGRALHSKRRRSLRVAAEMLHAFAARHGGRRAASGWQRGPLQIRFDCFLPASPVQYLGAA